MNNKEAKGTIGKCKYELHQISHLIKVNGHFSAIVPFLTKYAIVKTCGTVEFCFKTIIADIHAKQNSQIVTYIDKTIRNSSMNPSLSNIHSTLKKFDETWNADFKNQLQKHKNHKKIISSLESLNNARNSFAHGKNPTSSFENIISYFDDAIEILEILDKIVK